MGRSEFQFRVVPFLLLYDRELNAQGVWIEHEWAHYRYLPIAVNTEYQRSEKAQRGCIGRSHNLS